MGNSVQQWRSAIGSFYQGSFKVTTKKSKSFPTQFPKSRLWIISILLISTVSVFTFCAGFPFHHQEAWSPPLSRSTASSSSIWQVLFKDTCQSSTSFLHSPTHHRCPPMWKGCIYFNCSQGYVSGLSSTARSQEFRSFWCSLWPPTWQTSAGPSSLLPQGPPAAPCPTTTLHQGSWQVPYCIAESLFIMLTNFMTRYTNGNGKNKGIKICHWNKGGSFLINKMPEIKNIISQHHPHILGVSEANLLADHDVSLVAIQDYNLHVCPTITNPNLKSSRIVVYTHKDIVAKLRPDLMCDRYSSIWLEVGLPHHKKFLVSQSYREWQYTNQRGDKTSSTIPEQLTRWLLFLDQWERALASGREVLCLGDMNLNHCNWTESNLPRSNQTYKLRELISALEY